MGVCTPSDGGGLAYGPVVGVLRDLAEQIGEASALLAPARHVLGLDHDLPDTTPAAEVTQTQRFEALLACCTELGRRGRTVLVFEDLHWADSASIEVIDFLARNLRAAPVLVVATYRTDEQFRSRSLAVAIAELTRHRAVRHVELHGLDRDATGQLVSEILGDPPEWALLDAVHGRSGGNPFFAEELTAVRARPRLPPSLRNVVLLRIEQLGVDARSLVAIAAAAGRPVDLRVLRDAASLDPTVFDGALAEAIAGHVLVVDEHRRFAFRHALQREAVYQSLLPTERARCHRHLASAMSAHDDRPAQWRGSARRRARAPLVGSRRAG